MASTDVVKTEVNEKDSAGESVEQQAKETALGPVSGGQLPPDNNGGDATPPGPHMKSGLFVFFKDIRHIFKLDELGLEIADIAVPAALALAADPLASLVDTAFIGRIGPVQLAAVGVSIAVFNQVSKVAIYPLVSVTTSFVAEESVSCKVSHREQEHEDVEKHSIPDAETEVIPHENKPGCWRSLFACGFQSNDKVVKKRKYIPSVSSAIVVGLVLGILQTLLLIFAGKPILNIMGIKNDSPMMSPGIKYLTIRALGAPAVLLSLAMQGVFRGFKDTKTPLYATVAGDAANIILDPIFIFVFKWGVSGAALAHVLSQYLISLILLGRLLKVVNIVPPSVRDLKFSRFLKCGFLLLARVIAVTFCVTLAASMAARHGTIPMAAFQICLQLWLATSLLADGLAVAGQAILASAFAKGDLNKAVCAASRVLQLSIVLGFALTVILGVFMQFGSGVFTKDVDVVKLIHMAIPFVAGTQTINSLAFVFDGVNFGASDYIYSAYSMVFVSVISIICLYLLSTANGFVGIWTALTIYISLRALAGVWRMGAARGPWSFLRR